jgi:hypothetical protein
MILNIRIFIRSKFSNETFIVMHIFKTYQNQFGGIKVLMQNAKSTCNAVTQLRASKLHTFVESRLHLLIWFYFLCDRNFTASCIYGDVHQLRRGMHFQLSAGALFLSVGQRAALHACVFRFASAPPQNARTRVFIRFPLVWWARGGLKLLIDSSDMCMPLCRKEIRWHR